MQLSAGAVLLSMQAFVSFMRIRGKDFVNYVQDSRTQSCRWEETAMQPTSEQNTHSPETSEAMREISLAAQLDARRYAVYIEEDER